MEKVRNKMSVLTENFMDGLYYDREEYINQISYEEGKDAGIKEGKEKGIEERNIEIAKNMLKENISIDTIVKVTGLPLEELKKLKEEK